jgi:hypothetical protein
MPGWLIAVAAAAGAVAIGLAAAGLRRRARRQIRSSRPPPDREPSAQEHEYWAGEPPADDEPWADDEPQADDEPWADDEPQADDEPWADDEPHADDEPWAEGEPQAHDEPPPGQQPADYRGQPSTSEGYGLPGGAAEPPGEASWNPDHEIPAGWTGQGPPPAPAEATSRYANATIASVPEGTPWPRERPLETGGQLQLRVAIGPLAADSQVEVPTPFPDEYLPGGDLLIDIVVTSESFWVGRPGPDDSWARSQQDSFILPGDGRPARTADGRDELTFGLRTPSDPGTARLRVVYYYRGAVVQSQVLVADIGGAGVTGGRWSLLTDYTIAENLPSAASIPDRPRVAVVLHQDAAGQAIYARGRDGADGEPAAAVAVPPALADRVRALRQLLAGDPVAPTTVWRSKAQLTESLRALAPVGWELYAGIFPALRETFYQLDDLAQPTVLHIARPAGVGLSVPWTFLYTIGIDSAFAATGYRKVPLCPLVSDWDGSSPLVAGDLTACPHAAYVPHASNLLCPFGFLGMRHDIEQLSSSQRPVLSIQALAGSRVVIAETDYQVNRQALGAHIASLRHTVGARLPGVSCLEATSKAALAEMISCDLPLVYFYCHGERPNAASKETYLGIGAREWVTAPDFMSWVQEAYLRSGLRVWDQIRPLVFINACHSAELDPRALFNYVDAFVGVGNAAGVIGTEVRVHQDLAMRFAQRFFEELLAEGGTVAIALRRARLAFLASGNLFGLNYTPYCWADLALT